MVSTFRTTAAANDSTSGGPPWPRQDHDSIRRRAAVFTVAAAATAVAGAVLAFGVQPSTDITDDMWRYPWESSGAFVAFSLFSATLHGFVAVGLLAFGRSGAAGRSRAATKRRGARRRGTVLLLVGELASIPIRNAETSDTTAGIVGGGVFGVAGILSTIGFLVLGWATLRADVWHGWRRFTPLAVGISLIAMSVVTVPSRRRFRHGRRLRPLPARHGHRAVHRSHPGGRSGRPWAAATASLTGDVDDRASWPRLGTAPRGVHRRCSLHRAGARSTATDPRSCGERGRCPWDGSAC